MDLTFSTIGSQGSAAFVLFPIHAPRHRTACPSSAMWMSWWRGGSLLLIFCVVQILSLCSRVPIGIISVFSRLNFAPDARHQLVRISWSAMYESDSDRYIVVLSAYRFTMSFPLNPGISNPSNLGVALSRAASGSIARLKRRHESGSPCLTPLVTLKEELSTPLIMTAVVAVLYREFIVFIKVGGRLKRFRVSIR